MAKENIPVRFKGDDYVWLKNDDGSGPLAYPSHLDADGHVNMTDAFFSDSFAHVFSGGVIMRYNQQIGTVDDLEFIPTPVGG